MSICERGLLSQHNDHMDLNRRSSSVLPIPNIARVIIHKFIATEGWTLSVGNNRTELRTLIAIVILFIIVVVLLWWYRRRQLKAKAPKVVIEDYLAWRKGCNFLQTEALCRDTCVFSCGERAPLKFNFTNTFKQLCILIVLIVVVVVINVWYRRRPIIYITLDQWYFHNVAPKCMWEMFSSFYAEALYIGPLEFPQCGPKM